MIEITRFRERTPMPQTPRRARAVAIAEIRHQNALLFWRLTGLGLAALLAWYVLPPLSAV